MYRKDLSTGMLFALASSVAFAAKGAGTPPPPPASASRSGYVFDDIEIPATTRSAGGEPSKIALALAEVPMGKSFLEAVTVPATITDAGERDKAFKDAARKLTNKIGSNIRRYKKGEGRSSHNFALRTVNDDKMGRGVRVWRVADTVAPPAPPAV